MSLFAISPQQKKVWTMRQYDTIKNNGVLVRLPFNPEKEILSEQIVSIQREHEILRTTLVSSSNFIYPLMAIGEDDVALIDYKQYDSFEDIKTAFEENVNTSVSTLAYEISRAQDDVWISVVCSNLLLDANSLVALVDLVLQRYSSVRNSSAENERLQYSQYAAWSNQNLENVDSDASDFWKGVEEELQFLPSFSLGPKTVSMESGQLSYKYSREVSIGFPGALRGKLEGLGCDVSALAFACWTFQLSKLGGDQSLVSAWVDDSREYDILENTLGVFVKSLPHFTKFNLSATILDLTRQFHEDQIRLRENKNYYLHGIKDGSVDQSAKQFPFGFDYIDAKFTRSSVAACLAIVRSCPDNFKLLFQLIEGTDLRYQIKYESGLFDQREIDNLITGFANIWSQVINDLNIKLSEIDYISQEQRHLLDEFSKCDSTSQELDVLDAFGRQAAAYPSGVALQFGTVTYTYRELDVITDQLADHLVLKYKVGVNDIVPIYLQQSEYWIIAMLGILKSGAAYLPLEFNGPIDRATTILDECRPKCVLYCGAKPTFQYEVDLIDISDYPNDNDLTEKPKGSSRIARHAPAYVLYTSGSTGKPKGVQISHRSLGNLVSSMMLGPLAGIGQNNVNVGLLATYTFDASVAPIYIALTQGFTLHIIDEKLKLNCAGLIQEIKRNAIDLIDCTPALLNVLLEEFGEALPGTGLKYIMCGGESIKKNLIDLYNKHLSSKVKVVNVYGLTECTVNSTSHVLPATVKTSDIPIGKPLAGQQIYVLDGSMKIVPIGVAGEIYIGGAALAIGYLDKELTTARFVPNPFGSEKLFKTGDLGRWDDQGNLWFLGRRDSQVKIRGYRVELGEIEGAVNKHPDVDQAMAICRDEQLAVFYTAQRPIEVEALKGFLESRIPQYMIPERFVYQKEMPVNSHGKIDVNKLVLPSGSDSKQRGNTSEELLLVRIVSEVLKNDHVYVSDNFFEAGGDSIKAIQISSKLYKAGFKLDVKDILLHPVLSELAGKMSTVVQKTNQNSISGLHPLSPIQKRFFQRQPKGQNHYNQSVIFKVSKEFTLEVAQRIFASIIEHHDGLRVVFNKQNNVLHAEILPPGKTNVVSYIDLSLATNTNALERESQQIQSAFDLEKGPLIKAVLFGGENENSLLIVAHHLVIDGVSWRILIDDIETLYKQVQGNQKMQLEDKTASYREWSENLTSLAQSEEFIDKQLRYFTSLKSSKLGIPEPLLSGEVCLVTDSSRYKTTLEEEYTEKLLTTSKHAFNTTAEEMIITAFLLAMRDQFNSADFKIEMEGHGRDTISKDINTNRTIGWFTSVYPVLFQLPEGGNLERSLVYVKEVMRSLPDKGIGYGIMRYLTPAGRALSGDNDARISFNYLGQFDNSLESDKVLQVINKSKGNDFGDSIVMEHLLEVNSYVFDRKLEVVMTFSPFCFNDGIDYLGSVFIEHLKHLIHLGTIGKEALVTDGGADYDDLSADELKNLFV